MGADVPTLTVFFKSVGSRAWNNFLFLFFLKNANHVQSFDILSFTAFCFAGWFLIADDCVIGENLSEVLNLLFYPWDFVFMTRRFYALSESDD